MRPARSAVEIFLWSRGAIWLGALLALATLVPMRNPRAATWDDPALTHDLGGVTDVWARWDSVHFLRIAEHGYSASEAAFYPLYPALVSGVGRGLGGPHRRGDRRSQPRSFLRAAGRIAEERLGGDGARRAVLYLAFFPTALFLQAVYSESLFLFLCLGAFLLAERGASRGGRRRRARAPDQADCGRVCPPLVLIAGRRSWRLATALPIAAAYPLLLWWKLDDPWAFARRRDVARTSRRRAPRRNLGQAARRLGGSSKSRRLERTRLLDGRRPADSALCARRRSISCCSVSCPLRRAPVIAWRESARPTACCGAQPRLAAERSELALAAALPAALRRRYLPVLPRPCLDRRA